MEETTGIGRCLGAVRLRRSTTGADSMVCRLLASLCLAMAQVVSLPGIVAAQERLQPRDFEYLGAFRLPDDGERPKTFAWGGNAMTYRPAEGRAPGSDALPGSLFVMGHDRMAYGELPDGNQLAGVSIPHPLRAGSVEDLPMAVFLQGFHDVAAGHFPGLDELPRVGMAYLDAPETGPLIHLAWGQHIEPEQEFPTHAWIRPDLSEPAFEGSWFLGDARDYSANGYMFAIPRAWAEGYLGGPALATGRFRDGGWSGMGPSLLAYRPWLDENGTSAPAGTRLQETVLLHYRSSRETSAIEGAMAGYQHLDEWEGGAWIETPSGKTAVLFAGTKGVGALYWYGFVNPAGPEQACVAEDFVGEFPVCRTADGTPCPASDLHECTGHNGFRGWWSSRFAAQFILYDPAELGAVAEGRMEPWQPQPYAALTIDEHLFLNPAGNEPGILGTGPQRRYRIGDVAYDRENGLLYVLELFAEVDKPVVHVWQLD